MNIHDTPWTIRLLTEGCNRSSRQTPLIATKYFISLYSLVCLFYSLMNYQISLMV